MLPVNWLPRSPAIFQLVTRASWASREPFKTNVLRLTSGQSVRLHRENENQHDCQAVRLDTADGDAIGYLNADVAGFLAILLDHAPGLTDDTCVESVITEAPPGDVAARRFRYPRLYIRIRLQLASAWPMFAVAAVLGLKTDNFAERFNLAGNPWLQPLQTLHQRYLTAGHDEFQLPVELVKAWQYLTHE